MENSACLSMGWCLPLDQTTVSTGKALCSMVWQPQLDPCEKRGVPPGEGRGFRILHSSSPTEIRPLNNGRERFWPWKDFQHIACLHDQPFQSCPTLWDPTRLLCPWDFFWREYWSGLPFPPPGGLPDLGISPSSPALQADSLPLSHQEGPFTTLFTSKSNSYATLRWGIRSPIASP